MSARSPFLVRHGALASYVQPFDGCPDPAQIVAAVPPAGPVVWLDSARTHAVTGRWSLVGWRPWLQLTADGDRILLRTSAATRRWRQHPLEALHDTWRRYRIPAVPTPLRRALGLFGFLSYDLNRWIERLPAPRALERALPDLAWCAMGTVLLLDHLEDRAWLVATQDPHLPSAQARRTAREALEEASTWLSGGAEDQNEAQEAPRASGLQATMSEAAFSASVERALEAIRAGDIFQANVAQRFTARWDAPPLSLYRRLRRVNPSPFACYLAWDDLTVASCSPERLVLVEDGWVRTRPIAGTRPRGATPAEDAVRSAELLLSEKERAEHIMLVDLERNDVGRVAASGTVRVDELMALESYSHVIHIVSEVTGRLRPGTGPADVIRAMFPGGTITGCPKVRCMQLLHDLEPVARGLYTGSLGWLGFDGTMDLNIAIRTLVLEGPRVSFHVGAGIVADSIPSREYAETLAKAGALLEALGMHRPAGQAGQTATEAQDAAAR